MRALVTGASGFVGRHLCAALAVAGWEIVAAGAAHESEGYLPVDLRDEQSLRAALDIAQPEVFFHLAAIAAVPDALADPLGVYDVNALGTARLAHAVRTYRDDGGTAPRIVFASSGHVTGFHSRDAFLDESAPVRPDSLYAVTKVFGEGLARMYADKYGMQIFCIRIGQVSPAPQYPVDESIWLSPDDLLQLVEIALERSDLEFETVYGVSDNGRRWWSLERASQLGYQPRAGCDRYVGDGGACSRGREHRRRRRGDRHAVALGACQHGRLTPIADARSTHSRASTWEPTWERGWSEP